MKPQSHSPWCRRLMTLGLFFLVFSRAWAGERGNKPAAQEQEKTGKFSRLMKGLARPFGAEPAKKTPETAAKPGPGRHATAASPTQQDYIIGPGDVLAINVWQEPQISRAVPVRPDGRISIPLAGQLEASGLTPLKLQAKITESLKPYLSNPEVTVIVEKVEPPRFNILGEVWRPGSYELAKIMTVLDAIAVAGGFREFANVKEIYVLRRAADGAPVRLPFNYKEIRKGRKFNQNVELEPGDTIVVP